MEGECIITFVNYCWHTLIPLCYHNLLLLVVLNTKVGNVEQNCKALIKPMLQILEKLYCNISMNCIKIHFLSSYIVFERTYEFNKEECGRSQEHTNAIDKQ